MFEIEPDSDTWTKKPGPLLQIPGDLECILILTVSPFDRVFLWENQRPLDCVLDNYCSHVIVHKLQITNM